MKKIIALLLGICTCFGLVGCNSGEPNADKTNKVLLNSFETREDFDTVAMYGMLGIVKMNTDETFVKEGKASAKIIVESDPFKDGSAYLRQVTDLTKKGLNYSEFNSVGYVTFDVYNAQDSDREIGVQLVYDTDNIGMQKWLTLKSGWNSLEYPVERQYIPTSRGLGGVEERIVEGINFYFRRAKSTEPNEVYYLDNLQLHKTEQAVERINKTLNPDEILSFDKKWQVGELYFGKWMALSMLPNLSIEYLSDSPDRGGVLKIQQPKGYEDARNSNNYMGIQLSEKLLESIDWSIYNEDAKLCFDAYCPEENGINVIDLELHDNVGRKYYKTRFNLSPGVWKTYEVTVKELNRGLLDVENSENRFKYTRELMLLYGEEIAPERLLYIDNIRMEP